jgi:putative hemolysin
VTDLQIGLVAGFTCVLILDLFIVAAQAALVHTNHARLITAASPQEDQLNLALGLLNIAREVLTSLNLVQTLLHFSLAALVLAFFLPRQVSTSLLIWTMVVLLICGLLIWRLESVVEDRVRRSPEYWVLRLSRFTWLWHALLKPVLALTFSQTSQEGKNGATQGAVTEDELKSMVDAGQQEGVLEKEEQKMIYSIIQLGDTLAREIMVPRIDITAIEIQTPLEEAIDELVHAGHSRVPVYQENIDHILGLVYTKDLLKIWRQGTQIQSLRALLRPAYFVPEAKKLDQLMPEMQAQRIHMAIVVDEYGGIAGIVTLEDIVEEIVGEIQDEFDQTEELPYQKISDGEFIFQGRVGLNDFNEVMGSDLPVDEAETLGGFIYNRIGRVPSNGETMLVGRTFEAQAGRETNDSPDKRSSQNLCLTVEQVIGRRIRKVRAYWLPATVEDNQKEIGDDADK